MKTYQCDRCFKTKSVDEIVGTEFDYHGYRTLTKTFAPIRDVCGSCYDEIQAAAAHAEAESRDKKFDAARQVAFAKGVPPKRGILRWFS